MEELDKAADQFELFIYRTWSHGYPYQRLTKLSVYREPKPKKGTIEFTIYMRHNPYGNIRMDYELGEIDLALAKKYFLDEMHDINKIINPKEMDKYLGFTE